MDETPMLLNHVGGQCNNSHEQQQGNGGVGHHHVVLRQQQQHGDHCCRHAVTAGSSLDVSGGTTGHSCSTLSLNHLSAGGVGTEYPVTPSPLQAPPPPTPISPVSSADRHSIKLAFQVRCVNLSGSGKRIRFLRTIFTLRSE